MILNKNKELQELYEPPDIVRQAKAQMLQNHNTFNANQIISGVNFYGKPTLKDEDQYDDPVPDGGITSKKPNGSVSQNPQRVVELRSTYVSN